MAGRIYDYEGPPRVCHEGHVYYDATVMRARYDLPDVGEREATVASTDDSLDVLVSGGSMGGLFAGIALRQAGHDVTIFEQTERGKMKERGAGIIAHPEMLTYLEEQGIAAWDDITPFTNRTQHLNRAGEQIDVEGRATYSFTVPRSGTYRVWGRVVAANTGSDSFWIRMDGGRWVRWNDIRPGEQWHWDQVHNYDEGKNPVQFDLAAGEHRLTVAYREKHAKLDRLLVTSSSTYRPRGTGRRPDASGPFSQTLPLSEAALTPPMARADAPSTAATAGIGVPDGPGNDAFNSGPGAATWTFTVPTDGDYVLWGEVRAPTTNDNSFYVSMDGGEEIAWHTPAPDATTEVWAWDPVSRFEEGTHTDPVVFSLEAGTHRLRIRNREDGTRLRQLRITNRSASGLRAVRP
jgi:hypothetical protein